jgi:TPR repeat protein
MKAKADALYNSIGSTHPMSAYYLAHRALGEGDEAAFLCMLSASASAGYAPAITDLGCVLIDSSESEEGKKLLTRAMEQGDSEAAFRLGELLIKDGAYERAMDMLRVAWSKNHQDALNTAHWLCNEMLKFGLGKPGKLNRELKDIQFAISKRIRYENQARRNDA